MSDRLSDIEHDDEPTAREWVERLIGRGPATYSIAGALEEAERQADEARQQLKGAVYAREFLEGLSHLRCEADCEGFRDPCAACVVHEALRRFGGRS